MKDEERTPLRTVLINFLNHIENLESEKFPEKSYDSEFQDLKLFSESVKGLKEYSCLEGEKEVNRKKNRYKDILPFDVSRVILNEYAGIPGSDYINANYIKGASGSIAYIASQGPLPNTINDFWRMVVQCEVQVIVMACNEEEAGKTKCEKYWVEDKEEKQFGMVSVKLLKASTVCPDFSVRTMRLKYTNSQSVLEERTVCQLHYVAWPDHGVPSVVQPLLDMVRLVRDTQASETLPVLIHCSAGCGRTGTICAIDYVWGLLRTGKLTKDFSLLGLVREMRRQRIAMVQTKEQYVLVHQAVRELFKEQLNMIDSHPYENVDSNGMIRLKEEPLYDVVGSLLSNNSNEEKRDDKKEKEVIAPPIPLKRRPSILSSKEEKEVENLTARQKLLELADSGSESITSSSTGSGQLSKIDKLKSQFEVNSDSIPNNHFKKLSLSVTKKNELSLPIPSRGVLKVPQLELKRVKPISVVKRSKSLKLLSSEERCKLVLSSDNSGRRRSSLESNVEEPQTDRCSQYDEQIVNLDNSRAAQESRHVCQIVRDYEALCLLDRRPLGRSYTTLDMRQKPVLNTKYKEESTMSPTVSNMPVKTRRKISRSHTQLELKNTSQKVETPINSVEMFDKGEVLIKQDFYEFDHCDNVPLYYDISCTSSSANTSSNWCTEDPCKMKQPNRCDISRDRRTIEETTITPTKLHIPYFKKTESKNKELEVKHNPVSRVSNPYLRSPSQTRNRYCNVERFRSDQSKYLSEENTQYTNINGNCGESLKVLNKDIYSRARSTPSDQVVLRSKEKVFKKSKDQELKLSWDQQSKIHRSEDRGLFSRSVQEPIYTNMKFKGSNESSVQKLRLNRNPRPIEPTKNLNPCSNPCSVDVNGRFSKKLHIPLRRDPGANSIKQNISQASRPFQPTLKSKGSDSMNKSLSIVQTARAPLPMKSKANTSTYFSARDDLNDRPKIDKSLAQDAMKLDSSVSHSDDKLPSRVEEYSTLGHHLPLDLQDSCSPNHGIKLRYASQDDHAMDASAASSSSKVKRHTSVVLQRHSKSTDPAPWTLWTGGETKAAVPSQHWERDQPWQSAPGIDIDQVAASISQKEGNRNKIIKAALEALHIRKSKQSMESDHQTGGSAHHMEQSKKQEYL